MHQVFTARWWEAFGARAADTAIAAAIGVVALLATGSTTPLAALSTVAATVVAVLFTSFAGLPEVTGKTVPLWRAVIVRTLKTFGQTGAVMWVGVELVEAFDWREFAVVVGWATLTTLLRTLRDYLPEAAPEPGRHAA